MYSSDGTAMELVPLFVYNILPFAVQLVKTVAKSAPCRRYVRNAISPGY